MGMSRSDNMRRIRSKDTGPEITVRRLLQRLGFTGYRIHRKDLPGKPDIAFIRRKKSVLIHGCFWHGHDCKEGVRRPKSNEGYWLPKIERNRQRDTENISALQTMGWDSVVVWECELIDLKLLSERLRHFLSPRI